MLAYDKNGEVIGYLTIPKTKKEVTQLQLMTHSDDDIRRAWGCTTTKQINEFILGNLNLLLSEGLLYAAGSNDSYLFSLSGDFSPHCGAYYDDFQTFKNEGILPDFFKDRSFFFPLIISSGITGYRKDAAIYRLHIQNHPGTSLLRSQDKTRSVRLSVSEFRDIAIRFF